LKALLKAVYDALLRAPLFATIAGGIHWGLAPAEDTVFPFVILRPLATTPPDINTGDAAIEHRVVRVSIFSTSLDEVTTLLEGAEDELINVDLNLEAGYWMSGEKRADDIQLDPDRANDGSEVWQGILDIEFLVQR
jgi:hypothetical protein